MCSVDSNRLCDAKCDADDDVSSDVDDNDTDHADAVETDSHVDTPEMDSDNCEVCLIAPRNPRIALVPFGHQRFCSTCANRVRDEGRACPICRTDISFVLNVKSVLK